MEGMTGARSARHSPIKQYGGFMPETSCPRVYLAGPMVFYPDPEATFEIMKLICRQEGLEGVAPVDGQVSLEGIAPGRDLYRRIVEADFRLMDACDAALVCLNPIHGAVEMDAGTAVEIGYLYARGKPMSGWTTETATFGERIRSHCGPTVTSEANETGATSGLERDARGLLVHSSELLQHGMAQMPIEMSGGRVFSAGAGWSRAFRNAAGDLAARLNSAAPTED
jgi:nucleoside 2-deoxyribosyltransferase